MPRIYFAKIGRLGNNLIQYMTACIFQEIFGHTLVPYSNMCEQALEVHDNDPLFEAFKDVILTTENYKQLLQSHPFAKRDIILHGFFQQSELLLKFRDVLLKKFTSTNLEKINHSVRVCDIVNTKGFAKKDEIVVHLRLDDFQEETISHILHPKVYLQTLRKLQKPVRIVGQRPKNYSEELYFSIFEEISPTLQYDSLLTDFATLRDSDILMASNSTFAWCAAFLGHQKVRYFPEINSWEGQCLGPIEQKDILLPTSYVSLKNYPNPSHVIPLAGEQFQKLCDVTILSKEKYRYHQFLENFVPLQKMLFLDNTWESTNSLRTSEKVFVYQDLVEQTMGRICAYFTNIKVLIIHNGDTCIPLETFDIFFETFPSAHIYLQNNIYEHPQIHSLPMGVQNTMWRGNATYVGVENEPLERKHNLACCSWFGSTHPLRFELRKFLETHPFDGLSLLEKMESRLYESELQKAVFSFCPPGNAVDTHRLWETLYAKTIPIVLKDSFIQQLQKRFPSLPIFSVDSFLQDSYQEQLEEFIKEHTSIIFPKCLTYDYWKLLLETYSSIQE